MRNILWGLIFALPLFPGASFGFANKTTSGDCSPVITGDIKAPVTIECGKDSGIPPGALAKLEAYLQESHRSQKNLNDFIDKLRNEVADWEQKYKSALAQNTADREKHPDNPLLAQEQQALQAGELEQVAQIRERYYQNLKREKTAELAQEAFTAAERWENAFDMPKALTLYQEAVVFRRDYLEAWRNIGSIAGKLGNTTLALEAAQNLQKQLDPEKDAWWFVAALGDEADILLALGDNRKASEKYRQGLLLLEQLVKAEPDNLNLQRELSVSYNKAGDMHVKSGDNAAALKAYQESLATRKRLAELDPKHTGWQRDLSVSYNKVGDMHVKSGDNAAALKAYQESLAIRKRLAELDPKHTDWQRDLHVSHTKVGDMHVKGGDNAAALKAYQDGLAIAKRLAELDPKHTQWQSDLSVSYEKVGNMHLKSGDNAAALKAYQDGLAIAKRLAELDPKRTEWQRDLLVSYNKVGDMHRNSGDHAVALKAYQNGLVIRKKLAELDPNHTEWQRDLSVSHNKVGDMYVNSGDNAAALKAYQNGLAIAKRLAELDPAVVEWQIDLVVSYFKLSEILRDRQKELLTDALAILYRLQRENRLDHERQQWIGVLEGKLRTVSSGWDEPSAETVKP